MLWPELVHVCDLYAISIRNACRLGNVEDPIRLPKHAHAEGKQLCHPVLDASDVQDGWTK